MGRMRLRFPKTLSARWASALAMMLQRKCGPGSSLAVPLLWHYTTRMVAVICHQSQLVLAQWTKTEGGYLEACGGADGNVGTFSGLTVEQAQEACCKNEKCAGFDFRPSDGSGF